MRLAIYYDRHEGPLSRGEAVPPGSRHLVRWAEDLPDGSEKEKARLFKLKRDAMEHRKAINASLLAGKTAPSLDGKMLLSEVAPKWLAQKLGVKTASRDKFEADLRRRILPKFGHQPLGSIRRIDVEEWVQALLAGTAPAVYAEREMRQVGPLAPSTVQGLLSTLYRVFEYARKHEWFTGNNPAEKHDLPDPEETPRVYLDFEQLEALAVLVGSRVKVRGARRDAYADLAETVVLFMGYSGLRIGETFALRGSDVIVKNGVRRIRVARTWTSDNNRPVIGTTTKTGKTREVGLPDFVWARVDRWAERAGDGALFPAVMGGFEFPRNWRKRIWEPGVTDSAFEVMDLTPHDLRHTAASIAIASTADVKVVQEMLGHKSAAMTLDIYAALFPDRQDEVTNLVSARRAAALEAARARDAAAA